MSEDLDKPTPSIRQIAKKFSKSTKSIEQEIKKGEKVEHEHTSKNKTAREIARDHTSEDPKYYEKLNKAKLEEGQSDVDIDRVLAAFRKKESGSYEGNYAAKNRKGSASGAYQFIDKTWRGTTKQLGYGTEYKSAREAPREIQDKVMKGYLQRNIDKHGLQGAVNVHYTGNPQGKLSRRASAANAGQDAGKYYRDFQKSMTDYPGQQVATTKPSTVPTPPTDRPVQVAQAEPKPQQAPPVEQPGSSASKFVRKQLGQTEIGEERLNEISSKLAQRYYDKAMSKPFSKEHDIVSNPKGKHRELNRLRGVNLAVKKGANPNWKPGDWEKPKKVNSLKQIMRKKIKPYKDEGVMGKPTKREVTGFGRERLVKALKSLKGKAEAQSYTPRLATPQMRQPDLFQQGPPYPGDQDIIKAMAGRQRTLSKIERVTSRLNQYGEKDPKHPAKTTSTGISTRQIAHSKSYATKLQQVGKDKSPPFEKWYPGKKMTSGYATDKVKKEETTMDNKDMIREAIYNLLESNMVEMREYFNEVIEDKAIEKLDEAKRVIASSYFAPNEE